MSPMSRTAPSIALLHSDYTIGWICALPLELSAAKAMLDTIHPLLPNPGNDQNTYTLGSIGAHNIVIACISSGVYGMTSATRVASQMSSSFPSIRFNLLVGIGGGAPYGRADVRLGDVVVSHPTANFGGVVQYDYGKLIQEGTFQRMGVLNKPPEVLLTAISSLRADHRMRSNHISEILSNVATDHPTMSPEYTAPPPQRDYLFEAEYEHEGPESNCHMCDWNCIVRRPRRPDKHPVIHYGLIASANQVMKHGATRDKFAQELEILCFEMEAGGLMDNFPCLVVRGVCDYADSHKNKHWQPYAAATAAAFTKELLSVVPAHRTRLAPADQRPGTAEERREPANSSNSRLTSAFVLPFRRDPDFIDRPILDRILSRALEPGLRLGLVGLGGVGKSQIVIECAYRVRSTDPDISVFWVHASSAVRFEESYLKIATDLRLPECKGSKAEILSTVRTWLTEERNGRWMMILDNADDADVLFNPWNAENTGSSTSLDQSLSDFLPITSNGSILITSRNQDVVRRLQVYDEDILDIEPMEVDVAENLLLKKLKKGRSPSPEESKRLVKLLDYMPLAISQAAAYIDQCAPRMSVAKYTEMMEKNDSDRATLLEKDIRDPRRDRNASNSIVKTWYMTFTLLRQVQDSAARLLALMSMFDREAIPEDLLQGRYMENRNAKADFEDDIATLRAYSLIGMSFSGNQFSMHRLVQLSTQKWLEIHTELHNWQERLIDIISAVFPRGDYSNWKKCQPLFPHMQKMWTYRVTSAPHLQKWAAALCNGSEYAWRIGQNNTAEKMVRASMEVRQELLGVDNTATLDSIGILASVLDAQGKYSEAEKMHRKALAGRKKLLGDKHPNTLISSSNLAADLWHQGKYAEAESIQRQALAVRKDVLGMEHPDTLTSIGILATILDSEGRYSEAEGMHRQALVGRKKLLGDDHPDTLINTSNLAMNLWYQEKYPEAEVMQREVLTIRLRVLGKDHPDTLTSIDNLGLVLYNQHKNTEAEENYRQALAGYERVLGADHPDTLISAHNLAYLLSAVRRHDEALKLYQRVVNSYNRVYGPDHHKTIKAVENQRSLISASHTYSSYYPNQTSFTSEGNATMDAPASVSDYEMSYRSPTPPSPPPPVTYRGYDQEQQSMQLVPTTQMFSPNSGKKRDSRRSMLSNTMTRAFRRVGTFSSQKSYN